MRVTKRDKRVTAARLINRQLGHTADGLNQIGEAVRVAYVSMSIEAAPQFVDAVVRTTLDDFYTRVAKAVAAMDRTERKLLMTEIDKAIIVALTPTPTISPAAREVAKMMNGNGKRCPCGNMPATDCAGECGFVKGANR